MNTPAEQLKILIVEDEVIVARDIRVQAELLGYTVAGETRFGEEAPRLARELNPDLVLMDIQLGGPVNGVEAGRKIVEETGKPIVFLTAFASGDLFEEAKRISPAGYILKPFEERDLRIALEMALYKQKMEQELRLKSNALGAAANTVLITKADGRIEWANRAFFVNTGYNPPECLGKTPGELLKSGEHPESFYREMWETVSRGEVWSGEVVNKRKNGTHFVEQMTITPVFSAGGNITHYIAIKQDITEQKALERAYLRAQRMESIGTLAGGIAHDLNNILAPILMSSDLLLSENLSTDQRQMVELIYNAAKRGSEVIRQVLSFARGEESNQSEIQLRHLIAECCKIARETFPKNITVDEKVPNDLDPVLADPTQIHQVLMNLLINARDAMPEGGTVSISAENTLLDPVPPGLAKDLRPGPHIVISVQDTGPGIPDELLDRVFDPFFTTKANGKGSGLGLSSAMGIALGHKGALTVKSPFGLGACFSLYLATAKRSPSQDAPVSRNAIPSGKNQNILVVDDEDSILWMIRNALQALNYRIEVAEDGTAALEKLRNSSSEFDLVLMDIMMPGMDGLTLLPILEREFPKLPVIVMSGMLPEHHESRHPRITAYPFLHKPFSIEILASSVAKTLAD